MLQKKETKTLCGKMQMSAFVHFRTKNRGEKTLSSKT